MVDLYIPQEYWGELKTQSDLLFAVRIDNSLFQTPSFPYILDEENDILVFSRIWVESVFKVGKVSKLLGVWSESASCKACEAAKSGVYLSK